MNWVLCLGMILACCACAMRPQEKISAICNDCEQRLLNTSGSYPLSAYLRNMSSTDQHSLVHVYLEGDGRPWIRGKIPASNPTSRELTALRLMMLDQHPSVYLNRPCYGLNSMPTNCGNHLWTADRYSNDVIAVLNQALDQLQRDRMIQKWLLIGHSGGGSVAMLLAQRRSDVAAVVTLAANLDHRSWTDHFGYLPLQNSLNPIAMPPLPATVLRWHFAAPDDQQVPPFLTAAAAAKDPHARFTMLPDGDHSCCWQKEWPRILREMEATISDNEFPHPPFIP